VTVGDAYEPDSGFQEVLRRLAMIHEGFVQDKARLGLEMARDRP
jgi:hypothetical protein